MRTTTRERVLSRLIEEIEAAPTPVMLDVAYEVLAEPLGLQHLWLYIVDYGDEWLHPVPTARAPAAPEGALSVEGTLPGRVYLRREPGEIQGSEGPTLWFPVRNRSETVGVLAMGVSGNDEVARELGPAIAHSIAAAILESRRYSDEFQLVRGGRDLSVAAVLQWELLPLPTHQDTNVRVAGRVEPAEDVGGDAFDFAVNQRHVELALFDAMGHGIRSTLLTTLTVGSYRQSRRRRPDVEGIARDLDRAVAGWPEEAFVTGHVCRLDRLTGRLSWVNAGHPVPLLLRDGRARPLGEPVPMLPFGLEDEPPEAAEIDLQPGDVLVLYSDGVIEARPRGGPQFGLERLADTAVRHVETDPLIAVRAILKDVLRHTQRALRDDATLVLMRWAGPVPD